MKLTLALITSGLVVIAFGYAYHLKSERSRLAVAEKPSWNQLTDAEALAEKRLQEKMNQQRIESAINRISAQRQAEIAAQQADADLLGRKSEIWKGITPQP